MQRPSTPPLTSRFAPPRPAAITAIAGIVALIVLADVPGTARYASVLQNAAHAPAFAALLLLFMSPGVPGERSLRRCLGAFALALALALGTELVQWFIGRDAEWADVGQDALGAAVAALGWLVVHRALKPGAIRLGALGACVVLIGVWMLPLAQCAQAYWQRARMFPVLVELRSARDLYFSEVRGGPFGVAAGHFLEINLEGDRWPGLALIEPQADWRGWQVLNIEVSNPGTQPLRVSVRVDDRASKGRFANVFNGSFECAAGGTAVQRIALPALRSNDGSHQLDLEHISRLVVFHDGPSPGARLRIHRAWLSR